MVSVVNNHGQVSCLAKPRATMLALGQVTLVVLALGFATPSMADNDFFASIDLAESSGRSSATEKTMASRWSIKQLASYGLADPGNSFARTESGLNKMETRLQGELDFRFTTAVAGRVELEYFHDAVYSLNGDIHPSSEELDTFRNRVQARDIYLDLDLSPVWNLRAGNQIVAWGQAETLIINDLVAPLNNYTIMQADLKDLRLHTPAIKLTRSDATLTLDGLVTYDAGYNDLAPEGNEFDPFIQLRNLPFTIKKHKADRRSEYFFRVKHSFKGGDISLILADANHNELSLANTSADTFYFTQERIQALGLSGTYNKGLWVYKAEMAFHHNKPLMPETGAFMDYLQGWEKRDQALAMVGFDYAGFGDATFTLELNAVHTSGNTRPLAVDTNEVGATTSVHWSDENQKFNVNLHLISLLDGNGVIFRANTEYSLTDNLKLGSLLVTYDAGREDSLFVYRNNDAIQFYAQYFF